MDAQTKEHRQGDIRYSCEFCGVGTDLKFPSLIMCWRHMVTDHFQSLVPAIRQVVGSRPNAYALDPADIGSDNNPYTQTYEDREFWRDISLDRPPLLSPPEAMPRPVLGAADGGDGQPDPEPPDSTEGELVMPNTCTFIY